MMWPVMVKNNHIRTVLLSGQTPPPHLWRYHRSRFTHPLILTKWKTYVEVKRSYEWWQGQEEDTTPSFRRRRHVCPWRERFYHQTDYDGRCTPFPGLFQFRNIYLFGDVTTLHMNKAGLFFGSTDNVINVRICRAFHSSAQANISSHDINCNRIQGTLPMNGNGIELGQYAECRRTFSQEDVSKFGNLIGDLNQIHFPSDATGNPSVTKDISSVDRPIVHGMFLSSLFSSIFGTLVPGSIYRSQTLQFQSAVYVDEEVIGRVTVIKLKEIRPRRRIGGGVLCNCETKVLKFSQTYNDGGGGGGGGGGDRGDSEDDDDNIERRENVCVLGEAQVWLPGATMCLMDSKQNSN